MKPEFFFHVSPESYNDFAVSRSKLIDAFGLLELAVCLAANKFLDAPLAVKMPLGQRIAALAEANASSSLSKVKAQKLKDLCLECEELLTLRAEVVHSPMELGLREMEPVAIFCNAADKARGSLWSLVLRIADFQAVQADVEGVAESLRILEPPSKVGDT